MHSLDYSPGVLVCFVRDYPKPPVTARLTSPISTGARRLLHPWPDRCGQHGISSISSCRTAAALYTYEACEPSPMIPLASQTPRHTIVCDNNPSRRCHRSLCLSCTAPVEYQVDEAATTVASGSQQRFCSLDTNADMLLLVSRSRRSRERQRRVVCSATSEAAKGSRASGPRW
jgi:hypothetical protein